MLNALNYSEESDQKISAALTSHLLSLQYECGAASSAVVCSDDGEEVEVGGPAGSTVKDLPKITDVSEIKMLVSGLPCPFFKGLVELNYEKAEFILSKLVLYIKTGPFGSVCQGFKIFQISCRPARKGN